MTGGDDENSRAAQVATAADRNNNEKWRSFLPTAGEDGQVPLVAADAVVVNPLIVQAQAEWETNSNMPEPQVVSIDAENEDPLLLPQPSEITPLLPPTAQNDGSSVGDENNGQTAQDDETDDSPVFRDVWFAIVWLLHMIALVLVSIFISPKGYESIPNVNMTHEILDNNDDVSPEDWEQFTSFLSDVSDYMQIYPLRILVYLILPCAELAIGMTLLYTYWMLRPCTKLHVQASLIVPLFALVVLCAGLLGATDFALPSLLLTAILMIVALYFVRLAWPWIPFAAANLQVALQGVSTKHCGIYWVAIIFSELGFCWVAYWMYTTIGVLTYLGRNETNACIIANVNGTGGSVHLDWMGETPECHAYDTGDASNHGTDGLVFLALLISLYWTSQIILNMVHVTVAGVMATWCYNDSDNDNEKGTWCSCSCGCSSAVWASLFRSSTYSFGSICLGSLLQALVSALRYLVQDARARRQRMNNNDDDGSSCGGAVCFCVLEGVAKLLEDVLEYFNQWAYVYVGIYGFSYLESGKKVVQLFRHRGLTTVVTNRLVHYVLGMTVLVLGLLTGFLAVAVEALVTANLDDDDDDTDTRQYMFSHAEDPVSYIFGPLHGFRGVAFFIGLWVGVVVSSVMMNVIQGAVNTLIVCWADAPATLLDNHPVWMSSLADAWSKLEEDDSGNDDANLSSSWATGAPAVVV